MLANYALGKFYGACDVVLSPSPASDERLETDRRRARHDRPLGPRRRPRAVRPGAARPERCCPGEVNVLYAGRMTKEKGVELLADAFQAARARDPRLHLVLAGGGPEEEALRERLGDHATFLGWQYGAGPGPRLRERRRLPVRQPHRHLRPGRARGAGQRAAGGGGRARAVPATLIEDGETGLLAAADPQALADAVHQIVDGPLLAERLRRAALQAVRTRTWEAALGRLADGYRRALARGRSPRAKSPTAPGPTVIRARDYRSAPGPTN